VPTAIAIVIAAVKINVRIVSPPSLKRSLGNERNRRDVVLTKCRKSRRTAESGYKSMPGAVYDPQRLKVASSPGIGPGTILPATLDTRARQATIQPEPTAQIPFRAVDRMGRPS